MAFEIKNPTLKNIIDFLKNQLGSMSLVDDAPSDSKKYSRKNGFWVEVNDSGGGGGDSTNIGDEVYTEGDQLIIHSASTQIQDFFDNIAPEFDNTVSNSANDIVMYDNKLFTLTEGHTAPATWENTTHVTTSINDILKDKVNKSGDTMTGNLTLSSNTQLISSHISSTYWSGRDNAPFVVRGNSGYNFYYPAISIKAKTSSWEIGTNGEEEYLEFNNISDANHSTSTNTVTGYFRIKPNGYLVQPSLDLESTAETTFKVHNNSVTLGTTPSTGAWIGGLGMYANNQIIGYIESLYDINKTIETRILSRNKTNGTGDNKDNYIGLGVKNDGTRYVTFSHPQAWVKGLFPNNLTSTATYLMGITNSYANSGFITLPLPAALGGTGGTDSGWQTCNVSAFASSGTIKYRKIGLLLCIYIDAIKLTSSISAGGYLDCGAIIPSGYRPSHTLNIDCFVNSSNINVKTIPCRVIQTGNIYIYANKEEAVPSGNNILGSGVGFI